MYGINQQHVVTSPLYTNLRNPCAGHSDKTLLSSAFPNPCYVFMRRKKRLGARLAKQWPLFIFRLPGKAINNSPARFDN